jgi:hypothetical protein
MNLSVAAALLLLTFEDVTLDQIQALAKVYLRDSAEVPMNVDVTTVVTDSTGKVKHRGHLTAGMVFHGYNIGSGKFSLYANKGGLTPFGLGHSLSGGLATFFAGSAIFDKEAVIEIHQAADKSVTVIAKRPNCPALDWIPKYSFPQHPCGTTEITLGDLTIRHVSFTSTGSSGPANVAHLGPAQINAFQFSVDFQVKFLPGEDKPYLWPLETVVSATTDKGTLTITSRYSARR